MLLSRPNLSNTPLTCLARLISLGGAVFSNEIKRCFDREIVGLGGSAGFAGSAGAESPSTSAPKYLTKSARPPLNPCRIIPAFH